MVAQQQPPASSSTARENPSTGKKRAATPIPESASSRNSQQSGSVTVGAEGRNQEGEQVKLRDIAVNVAGDDADEVKMRATVDAAVRNAVNELVGSDAFLQTISSLVAKTQNEKSIAAAKKKVPVNRAQQREEQAERG